MDQTEALKIFKETNALLEGHFLLSSGLHSEKYFQCALVLQYPDKAEMLCRELAEKFKGLEPEVVISPALGGVFVSYEVARHLGTRGIFTERVDGKMCLRRGFDIKKGERVVIVEDVITTGLSTKEVMEVVRAFGGNIVGVGCIADRTGGKAGLGMEIKSILKLEVPAYKPEGCPLCKKNIPFIKPGSRGTK